NSNHPYEIYVASSPASDLAPGESAVVRGAVYEIIGTDRVLVDDSLTFNFTSNLGSFTPSSKASSNGYAQSVFNRSQTAGPAQIIVTTEIFGVKLGGKLILNQTDDT